MKSKLNSNIGVNHPHKVSCLISERKIKKDIFSISYNYKKNAKRLNLPNCQINDLSGIEQFKDLTYLNLNNNQIADFDTFTKLNVCTKLRQIQILDNPITQKSNYLYGILSVLKRKIKINNINFINNISNIKKWQQQNGQKICLFLMQCAQLINKKQHNQQIYKLKQLDKQIKELKTYLLDFQQISKQGKSKSQFIQNLNIFIQQSFPLKSMKVQRNLQQIEDVKNYLLEMLIIKGSQQENPFIFRIVSEIEVRNQEDEQYLVQKKQASQHILSGYIEKQYQLYQKIYQKYKDNDNIDETGIKHLVSTETALDTIDLKQRKTSICIPYFALDSDFLCLIVCILNNQLERLSNIVFNYSQNTNYKIGSKQQASIFAEAQKSYQQQQPQEFELNKSGRIYNNSCILSNIVNLFEHAIKKIVFRKILSTKYEDRSEQLYLLQNIVNKIILNQSFQQFKESVQQTNLQIHIQTILNKMKMKRLFSAWKKIKAKKLKLLKNIVKRKIKNQTFLSAITITKWKIITGSSRIQRMASAALLRTSTSQKSPLSKKGVNLAYQRAVSHFRRKK